MSPRQFHVYILASRSRCLYVGITSDLAHRVEQHKRRAAPGFAARYRIDRLVYAEAYAAVMDAIRRRKQIKGWSRAKKVALIEAGNPDWRDLAYEGSGGEFDR